jgi:fatty-acyl-CoA synthase
MLLDICPEIAVAEPGRVQSAALPHLKNVVLIDGEAPGMYSFMRVLADGAHGSDAELAAIAPELDPDDPINIQYTSGTTGFPKGVVLSHFNILNNAQHVAHVLGMTHVDRLLIQVPFYHCFGMVLSCLGCATQGATMVIPSPTFDPLPVMQAITDEKCTVIYGVPTMFLTLLTHPDFGAYDFRSLRTGIMAGAPCPIETMKDLIARMYMREVVIAYGQTEVSPVATLTRRDDPLERRVGTVGRVLPMQEIKVIDPATAKTVPRGVPGEICFRGYQVMRGYYRNPAATAEAIDAGRWLHSGDLGVMDEQGYLKITGRLKEMVIRGGENLYPREIEEFLRTHPGVLDVYVVGVPDLKYGEELMAWVLPRDGETLTAEALREFCKGKITHFKVPRYWKFVRAATDFPMTVTGKIQKFRMKEIAIDELNLHAAASVKTA